MYSRAERRLSLIQSQTSSNLGPGYYASCVSDIGLEKEISYAPFATLTPRVSAFDEMIKQGPAPGSYDALIPKSKSYKTSTFGKSLCDRFKSQTSLAPGPGAYDCTHEEAEKDPSTLRTGNIPSPSVVPSQNEMVLVSQSMRPGRYSSKSKQNSKKKGSGKKQNESSQGVDETLDERMMKETKISKYRKSSASNAALTKPRIVWKRKSVPPSIPVGRMAYGYAETETGELVPRHPPKVDRTMGPAFYNSDVGFVEQSKSLNRGIKFSQGEVERLQFSKGNSPGPANYETVNMDRAFTVRTAAKAAMAKDTKRFGELIEAEEKKKSVPGPGAYNLRSKVEESIAKRYGPSFAASTADRFSNWTTSFPGQGGCSRVMTLENPGPGTYGTVVVDSFVHRTPSALKPPTAVPSRFEKSHNIESPGPAAYFPDDDILAKRGITSRKSNKSKAFGSLADRFGNFKVNRAPGPGAYETVSKGLSDNDKSTRGGTGRRRKVYHQYHRRTGLSGLSSDLAELSKKRYGHETAPVFGTAMDRFENPLGSDIPPPGAYDTAEAYHSLVMHGRLHKHNSPISQTKRQIFSPVKDVPGPGEYEPRLLEHRPIRRDDGTFITKTSRFRHIPGEEGVPEKSIPGPGTYLSQQYDHSLVKRTFNVTYAQPSEELRSPQLVGDGMIETYRKSKTAPILARASGRDSSVEKKAAWLRQKQLPNTAEVVTSSPLLSESM